MFVRAQTRSALLPKGTGEGKGGGGVVGFLSPGKDCQHAHTYKIDVYGEGGG